MKRSLCVLLTIVMVLSAFGGFAPRVYANESGPAPVRVSGLKTDLQSDVQTDLPDDLPDNDDAFAGYVDQVFGVLESNRKVVSGGADMLTSQNDIRAYNKLAALIKQVAAGELSSTEFEITAEELGIAGNKYTAKDLGVDSLLDDDYYLTDEAWDAISAIGSVDCSLVVWQLMYSMPYELYWFDKTVGYSYTSLSLGYDIDSEHPDGYLYLEGSIEISLSVAEAYALNGQQYAVDTSIGKRIQTSAANAKSIVSSNASLDDYEKVVAYKDAICGLVEYNHDAAEDDDMPYGDPWQLIWVFDGDASTNVVCEGYSKAFHYLCQLSKFKSNKVGCVTVSGYMSGGTGGGGHMWNILSMDDGVNYLVDVTNCDDGTIGSPDLLFLKGVSGSVSDGYVASCYGTDIYYFYDGEMSVLFDTATLTLSSKDYVKPLNLEPTIRFATSISLDSQIALNVYIGQLPSGASASQYTAKVFVDGKQVSSTSFSKLKGYELTADGITSTYYYLKVDELAAKRMTDEYVVKVYRSNTLEAQETFSIRGYCESRISDPKASAKNKLLCRATLTYGAQAQKHFGYKTYDLADWNIDSVTLTAIPADYAVTGDPTLAGISKVGTSGSFEAQVFLNLYFVPESGYSLNDFTFSAKLNGEACTVTPKTMSNGYIHLQMPSVVAKNLGTSFDITVTNKTTGKSATWHRSAMNYAYITANGNASDTMKNLVKGLYQYYLAAK